MVLGLLFNIVMYEVITKVRKEKGYKMNNNEIKIRCYTDEAILLANSEDDLKKFLHAFNTVLNMVISPEKNKSMTISVRPLRCRLEIVGRIIQQEMSFKYLGVKISS